MCEKHLGQCFVLTALHRLPSHTSVFTFCFPSLNFFSMRVFKREIISQSVLTWLKILVIVLFLFLFFFFLRNRQKCSKYFSSSSYRLVIFYILQRGFKFSS